MSILEIRSIKIDKNRIDIYFSTSEDLDKYFSDTKHFWAEYSIPLNGVSYSMALVPFVCNILPIIWMTDSELILSELDIDFYDSINKIKEGYIDMYPQLNFGGKINVDKLVDNKKETDKIALLFSGGLDAFSSLAGLASKQPELVTIWGADVSISNETAWTKVEKHIKEVADEFNLNYIVVKSNFRIFLDVEKLNILVAKSGDNYWHGFQHGIALVGLTAPYANLQGVKNIYISSSFTEEMKKNSLETSNKIITCASDPSIDNFVCFGSTSTIHYQYEMNRQMKTQYIYTFSKQSKKNMMIRVCWLSINGDNCCKCEKCYRTICGFWAEGADANDYGFNIGTDYSPQLIRDLKTKDLRPLNWENIQSRFIENRENIRETEFMEWIINADFDKINNSPSKKMKKLIKRVYNKFKYITRKILNYKNK